MKVPKSKPRNPLVAPAHFRKAGTHKLVGAKQHRQEFKQGKLAEW